ncbi:hypothetical protein DV738_g1847, partial [Chaetothyriales sp. CBS 135597]
MTILQVKDASYRNAFKNTTAHQKCDVLEGAGPSIVKGLLQRLAEFPPARAGGDICPHNNGSLSKVSKYLEAFFGSMKIYEEYNRFQKHSKTPGRGRPKHRYEEYAESKGILAAENVRNIVKLGANLANLWITFAGYRGIFFLLDQPATLRSLSPQDARIFRQLVNKNKAVSEVAKRYNREVEKARDVYEKTTEALWEKDKINTVAEDITKVWDELHSSDVGQRDQTNPTQTIANRVHSAGKTSVDRPRENGFYKHLPETHSATPITNNAINEERLVSTSSEKAGTHSFQDSTAGDTHMFIPFEHAPVLPSGHDDRIAVADGAFMSSPATSTRPTRISEKERFDIGANREVRMSHNPPGPDIWDLRIGNTMFPSDVQILHQQQSGPDIWDLCIGNTMFPSDAQMVNQQPGPDIWDLVMETNPVPSDGGTGTFYGSHHSPHRSPAPPIALTEEKMAMNRVKSAFAPPRKGETFELRAGLVSQYAYERKEAIQKTIMAMTLGKDVSALFPDVLKNIATADLDQKKLVYLYLMNYAKSHPDLCILAVNTFVQDAEDPNPLVRALAIRTMGCIRVDKMIDYMEEPLRKTLRDESPYVRKTAAICVAKLYDLAPATCVENGFLETLQELIGDPNPMVVANSVTALAEIMETSPDTHALKITPTTLKKLLMALNECTEWGRVTILTTLANYKTHDVKESEHICERVVPQFQHVNSSVVLAAVKAVLLHMNHVSPDHARTYLKKMAPPLVTLVSSAPEVQYVALRNIDLILQKQPDILSKELRVFFCKYNDPPYVKFQKLEIMVRIANESNVDQLLMELKEYALEVDMDFVRRAVKAIGQVAIKIENASERCVNALLDLINTKVNYVVQEVIVVIKDIFRKYPGYEGIIPTLCKCIDELDEPNARGAMIWIVGEYADKISNAGDILASFVDGFAEEFTQTQLQILTAVIKLFLKRPQAAQGLVQKVLQTATAECDNPDIRDRAYVYWRLLSNTTDANASKNIILSEKPPITSTIKSLPPVLLERLLTELSTLASVYHLPPEQFIGQGRFGADAVQQAALEEQMQNAPPQTQNNAENLLDIDFDGSAPASATQKPTNGLTGLEGLAGTPQRVASPGIDHSSQPTQPISNNLEDLLGNPSAGASAFGGLSDSDILNGLASMDLSGNHQPGLDAGVGGKKTNEDLLSLF